MEAPNVIDEKEEADNIKDNKEIKENEIQEEKDEVKMEIEENSKKILIQITISTIINQNEGEKLFSQKCELTEVKRIEDPAITF